MKRPLLLAIVAFFAIFLVYPLVVLLGGAFFVETVEGEVTRRQFSLQYFSLIFENPFYRECFTNSLLIAVWTTGLCLLVSMPLAYAFLRYRFPGKTILSTLLLVPLILPPFVGAIGLKQLFSRFGSVNLVLAQWGWIDLQNPPDWFGAGGFYGIILLETLHLYPIMFLSIQAALANLDPSMRDAAMNLGARGFRVFRTITLPLAMPGVFAGSSIVFVSAFTDLGVPLMFDFQTTVPTQIFNLVTQADNPVGYALVVLTLLLVSILFFLGKKLGEGNYAMMARSASYDDTVRLRPLAAWGLVAGVSAFILISILPHLSVILQSVSARWFFSVLPTEWTTEFYAEVFALDLTSISIRNSLLYATSSAFLDLVLGLSIAYMLARQKFAGRNLLDIFAMLPLALPGLVLAFAYFVAFTRPIIDPAWAATFFGWFGLEQTPGFFTWVNESFIRLLDPRENPIILIIIAYSIHRLPYIVRAAYAGFQQLSVSLEEASANMGAPPAKTMLKIVLPLISANLIAGTILTFAFAMLDVSTGMILAQESQFFPITKAIYVLMGRITPTAPAIACALGVLAMILLAISFTFASKLLGQKMGQLFKT
jgi:iron(III) transport system permease protein